MVETSEFKISLPLGVTQEEAKLFLAVKLFELGKLSLGKAAEMAGYSKKAFMEVLGKHKVPIFNYSDDELRAEIQN
ncbi:MAG: UPF0175 family protein [Bacteroidetes bacterium]|nr:UPF0175 family protein [Bacteroidota bacterium]